jgi:hypothetical protein
MSGKSKIEKDYRTFDSNIEQIVAEEIRRIQTRTSQAKAEAQKIGEAVEKTINQSTSKPANKKS